jgi:hypothetical protein
VKIAAEEQRSRGYFGPQCSQISPKCQKRQSILVRRAAVRCCELRGLRFLINRGGGGKNKGLGLGEVQSAVQWFDDVTDI